MTRSITIDDLYRLKILGSPNISPDGQHIAYVVTSIDEHKHKYLSSIWVASLESGKIRRFTASMANASSPAWSPDGRWLAFVSKRTSERTNADKKQQKLSGKDKAQIWVMPTDGGEAYQLTFMEYGASSPVWSPDSQQVLFSAQVKVVAEEVDEDNDVPKIHVIDQLFYRMNGVGFTNDTRTHLYVVDHTGGEVKQITDGDWNDSQPVWSPDGTQIAYLSNHDEQRWSIPKDDLYILSLSDGDTRRVTDGSLSCSSPSWSPDGRTIAMLTATIAAASGYAYLSRIDAHEENASLTVLTKDCEFTCSEKTNSDVMAESTGQVPVWSADGQTLFVLVSQRGAGRVYAVSAFQEQQRPVAITGNQNIHVRSFTVDAAKQTLALLVGDATHPHEIYTCAINQTGSELQRISHDNDEFLADLHIAELETISYVGADGWLIEGWIIKPHDFDPTKKYPLVTEVHGGPNTQYGYAFFHEMQVLAAQGYVVFFCNPRGSVGYGYEFADAVRQAWGEKDSVDIMLGIDEVIKQGYIDETRLAITGGSYGGFMTNWLITHYDRFKVAITDRCVSNMATMFGVSDIGWHFVEDHMGTTPWEDLDKYMQRSPIALVNNIHTPLLIIHSEQDLRCNIEQAEQLFVALKYLGREVKFVRFEGQNHELSRSGHPKLRKARLQHMLDWFAQHV